MLRKPWLGWSIVILAGLLETCLSPACAQPLAEPIACIRPEQRDVEYRPPMALPDVGVPEVAAIPTVADPLTGRQTYYLSLDEALQIAISNCRVIRVLNGITANSTGSTIYDAAITNTRVDEARARFDPRLSVQNSGGRIDSPIGVPDANDPSGARFQGTANESFTSATSASKIASGGGTGTLSLRATPSKVGNPGQLLNPQTSSSLDLSLSQPLLRGRGRAPNLAPIVIARIDTERSFYQLQDSVQDLVRSIVEGYWGIVFARTDIWARQQQIKQLQFAFDRFDSSRKAGRGDLGDTAQAKVSLANFKATLIAAEAELINREEALSNALGLPPGSCLHVIPSTPPQRTHSPPVLQSLLQTAEQHRPDIVRFKLLLEVDEQQLTVARNNSLPQVDATALYRWNGLQGTTATGTRITTQGGEFADWQLGANLSVQLGVRADRAALRRAELLLARDRSLLDQQVHTATHEIAGSLRNLEQFYAQFKAFQVVREAAQINLQRQFDFARIGGIRTEPLTYVNVLLAITDWGNSVSGEARSLTAYNSELARLDRLVGTILQRHGVQFAENDYESLGPRYFAPCPEYPATNTPTSPRPSYEKGDKPSEQSFDLNFNAPSPTSSKAGAKVAPKDAEDLKKRLESLKGNDTGDNKSSSDGAADIPKTAPAPASTPTEPPKTPGLPPVGMDRPRPPSLPDLFQRP